MIVAVPAKMALLDGWPTWSQVLDRWEAQTGKIAGRGGNHQSAWDLAAEGKWPEPALLCGVQVYTAAVDAATGDAKTALEDHLYLELADALPG